MATPRTEVTELAVAFGLLGTDPLQTDYEQVQARFENTLTKEKFIELQRLLQDSTELAKTFEKLFRLGQRLKRCRPELFPQQSNVRWLGPVKQSRTVAASQDLVVGTTSISVKAESKVVFNLSPYNLFVSLPRGKVFASQGPHWFLTRAPREYQRLFEIVSDVTPYTSVEDFEREASRSQRKALRDYCSRLSPSQESQFSRRYREMCHKTAQASALEFQHGLSATLATIHASGVRDTLLRTFFRLDSSQYVICGLERGDEFAFLLPSITEWKRHAELRDITVEPDLEAGQSKVLFSVDVRVRDGGLLVQIPFHAEIRWSHGRFCGNPEAKLYRDFDDWSIVPGIDRLL